MLATSPEKMTVLAGSVSWLRAYSMPCSVRAIRAAVLEGALGKDDARRLLRDGQVVDGDEEFWDIQALRRSHIVRIVSASSIECRSPTSPDWIPVETHLVLHEAGLTLIRLTLDPILSGGTVGVPELASYSDALWENRPMAWRIRLAGKCWALDADVRGAMDAVMLPMHERFCGREPNVPDLLRLETVEERYRWREERVEAGESLSAYPQTFGTAYELVLESRIQEQQSLRQIVNLAHGPNVDPRDPAPERPAETGHDHDWFIGENRAVLVLGGERKRNTIGTFDALRTQTLEYLTLQRAALRSVQRASQLSITERRTIDREQLQQWQRLVAALTDEYVLHDQVATTLRPLLREMRENPLLRDPATLEAQVHQNLGTFLDVLNAASHRVAIILSGLFGVVAAITLAPMVRDLELAVFKTGGSVSDFDNRHLILSVAIDSLLLVLVAFTSAILIARANRLRWPRR